MTFGKNVIHCLAYGYICIKRITSAAKKGEECMADPGKVLEGAAITTAVISALAALGAFIYKSSKKNEY